VAVQRSVLLVTGLGGAERLLELEAREEAHDGLLVVFELVVVVDAQGAEHPCECALELIHCVEPWRLRQRGPHPLVLGAHWLLLLGLGLLRVIVEELDASDLVLFVDRPEEALRGCVSQAADLTLEHLDLVLEVSDVAFGHGLRSSSPGLFSQAGVGVLHPGLDRRGSGSRARLEEVLEVCASSEGAVEPGASVGDVCERLADW